MSLVSVGNFTAPFRNRVHLITIVLVTIVFATLRLSGASIEVQSKSEPRRAPVAPVDTSRAAPDNLLNPFGRQQAAQPQAPRIEGEEFLRGQRAAAPKRNDTPLSLNPNSQGDLIEDVMRPPAAQMPRNKAVEQNQADRDRSDAGSLSDIEKQLGLK